MSQDEFWKKDPDLFWAYRLSYFNKRKEEDYNAWNQGRYMLHALTVALSNAFSKNKRIEYPSVPYWEQNKEQHVSSLQERLLKRVQQVQAIMRSQNEE